MGKIKDMGEYLGSQELHRMSTWRAVLAEMVGTMVLVFIGCASCLTWGDGGDKPSIVQIAFAFGITIASVAQAIGHVSGCHINPAITCGLLLSRYVSVTRAILYITAQCMGSISGAAILYGLAPQNTRGNLGATQIADGVNLGQALGVEIIITFVLVLTVFGCVDERRSDVKGSAPLAIGLSVTACHLAAVPITGASMNPARSFGPAVIIGTAWENHWVYWGGPIIGGLTAALLYTYLFRQTKAESYDLELDTYNKNTNTTNP
ncbi:hypothetical protein Pmani_006912 [Petrolisthes manimaculis]|uniref:Uncharacterized protein n=1 Tax=Petrolisthes manimaculis TaxID=1843537 RepID=A0AAE1QBM1_9EUCA|nr:hypothetical protein Pmani_006912 [Petrolisthes manimaculis]